MAQSDDWSPWGFLGGLLVGVLLTGAYVRFGYQPRNVLTMPAQMTSAAISMTADVDLENWDTTPDVRQRAAAVILGQDPERFVALDDATGNVLTRELFRQKAARAVGLARSKIHAYDLALEKLALREVLARQFGTNEAGELKRCMLLRDLRDDAYLFGYLTRRFPDAKPDDLVNIVLSANDHGLGPEPIEMAVGDSLSLPR